MEMVSSIWFVTKCYQQDQSSSGVEKLSADQLSAVTRSSWLVSERVQLTAVSRKSASEEKTKRLVSNGRQRGKLKNLPQ
jgi:hypothetical protein